MIPLSLERFRRPLKTRMEAFRQDNFGDYDDDDDDYNEVNRRSALPMENNNKDEPTSIPSHFFSKKSLQDPAFLYSATATNINNNNNTFNAMNGDDFLFQKLCQGAGISRPSRIQALAWPTLLQGRHTIVADQTGSGKTLAYLLPLLQRALSTTLDDNSSSSPPSKQRRRYGSPRILILTPTAELADQIRAVCTQLQTTVSFSTLVMTATGLYVTNIRDQIRLLQRQQVDVLISTPGRMATILRTKQQQHQHGLNLTNLQSIVLDEVDVLLNQQQQQPDSNDNAADNTFGDQLRTIARAAPVTQCQFVFVTATLPDRIVQTITQEFPKVVQVRGPGLHRVAPTLDEQLMDVSVPPNSDPEVCFKKKADALLQALRRHSSRKTLVFCNTVPSCRQVENILQRHDRRGRRYQVGAYHNAMTPPARNQNLARFNTPVLTSSSSNNDNNNNKAKDNADDDDDDGMDQILVCTDRAARGVDFGGAPVDHVILFDFPKDPAEYVRRVGRTARAGRPGTCTILAYGWQLPIARQLMKGSGGGGGGGSGSKTANRLTSVIQGWEEDRQVDSDDDVMIGRRRNRRTTPGQPNLPTKRNGKQQIWKSTNSNQDEIIKGNIEGGRLWKEKKVEQPDRELKHPTKPKSTKKSS